MKYTMLPIHIIPFEIPERKKGVTVDGTLLTTTSVYPKNDDTPNITAMMVLWKYRLSHEGKHILTAMGESKFMIENDGNPFNEMELNNFLKTLYLQFELGWADATTNTPLHGSSLPAMTGENMENLRLQVVDVYLQGQFPSKK